LLDSLCVCSYFLVITVMQGIPAISPFPIYTSLVPFVFILSVSAIKDGWEDLGRHRADVQANGRTYSVLMEAGEKATAAEKARQEKQRKAETSRPGSAAISTGDLTLRAASTPSRKHRRRSRIDLHEESECFRSVTSKNIRVGQVLRVKRDEEFPADLLLLSSSSSDATAFVNTANLDGEAVPKIRSAPLATCDLITPSSITSLRGSVVVEKPTASMYRFQGRLQLEEAWVEEQRKNEPDHTQQHGEEPGVWRGAKLVDGCYQCPLGDAQLLLRGSKLVNTSWVFGIVVYSGPQSKLMLNRSPAKFKFSKFEKILNGFVIQLFIFNLLICLVLAAVYVLRDQRFAVFWDIDPSDKGSGWILNALTQYILFSFMIPMSLIVTIELVKVGQALFMESVEWTTTGDELCCSGCATC
jgi:phospholipid-transporting ATPase